MKSPITVAVTTVVVVVVVVVVTTGVVADINTRRLRPHPVRIGLPSPLADAE